MLRSQVADGAQLLVEQRQLRAAEIKSLKKQIFAEHRCIECKVAAYKVICRIIKKHRATGGKNR